MTIISLGSFCLTTKFLKRCGLRSGAYPFDWLFCSVTALIDILDDDFARFRNVRHYQAFVSADGVARCMHGSYDHYRPLRPFFQS